MNESRAASHESLIKYKVKFYKKGYMVYISHLDLMKLFRRALRRSGLPYVLTGGFNPRVKISMPKALKVGTESDSEEMELWLKERRTPEEIREALNKEMPEGIGVLEIVAA